MGGKFYVSIHVSFANACVAKGYKNREWFGFGDECATIFCVLIPATMPSGQRLGKPVCRRFPLCLSSLANTGWPVFAAIALRSSAAPPVLTHAFGVWVPPPPRLRRTSRPPFLLQLIDVQRLKYYFEGPVLRWRHQKSRVFRSPNPPRELRERENPFRESAKFSVSRIPGTREF